MSPALGKSPSASWSVPTTSNSPPLTCLVSISLRLLAVFSEARLPGKRIYYICFNWPRWARQPGISAQEETALPPLPLFTVCTLLCLPSAKMASAPAGSRGTLSRGCACGALEDAVQVTYKRHPGFPSSTCQWRPPGGSSWVGVSEAQEEHWLGPRPHGDRECSQPGIMVTLGVILVHTTIIPAIDSSMAS